ncbi:hypothetical protein, partial [Bartonella schoenbuchensis]|uniref:hypothetical protein n=1 Tax=Bartonella schoenbuchensis TaxID=165694 RepID=UPI001ABBD62B
SSPAIKVESGGKLRVMNVTATNVYKGIEAEDGGSVTVLQGSIGLRESGVVVIEVKDGGKVTLNEGVKVTGLGSVGV